MMWPPPPPKEQPAVALPPKPVKAAPKEINYFAETMKSAGIYATGWFFLKTV